MEIPTGVMTMMVGAVVLVVAGTAVPGLRTEPAPPGARPGLRSARTFWIVVGVLVVPLVVAGVLAMLAGRRVPAHGRCRELDQRRSPAGRSPTCSTSGFPRVAAAVLCGAALAIAGTTVQAVCRNPLAEPGILGITGGAGVGAVITLTLVPSASIWLLSGVAAPGALGTFALVYRCRGGAD